MSRIAFGEFVAAMAAWEPLDSLLGFSWRRCIAVGLPGLNGGMIRVLSRWNKMAKLRAGVSFIDIVTACALCSNAPSCGNDSSAVLNRSNDSGMGGTTTSGGDSGAASGAAGASSNGGASNGGASNGGASNGGASNGGASNGGASNGGASGATGGGGFSASGGVGGGLPTGGSGGAAPSAPLDMYVLFDKTTSMMCAAGGSDRWTVASTGFEDFLSRLDSSVGVGFQFWTLGDFNADCTVTTYATPAVEIAPAPDNVSKITNAIGAATSVGITAPGPAVEGGVEHAKAWATAHPTHTVVVVLMADGMTATACTGADPVAAATAGKAGTPSIATYVVALIGSTSPACSIDPAPAVIADFDPVARAGGTTSALNVDVDQGPGAVRDSLNAIVARHGG